MMPPDIVGPKMDPEQLYEAVTILLSLQVSFIPHIERTSSTFYDKKFLFTCSGCRVKMEV